MKELKAKLEKLGVSGFTECTDNSFKIDSPKFLISYYQEERETLAFYNNDTPKMVGTLQFNEKGDENKLYNAFKVIVEDTTTDKLADWIYKKIQNPNRDPEIQKELETMKNKIMSLGFDWLNREYKIINISQEIEKIDEVRIDLVSVNYNDIVSDDHVLFQIKTLLDTPGEPKLYLMKTVSLPDNEVSEVEFNPEEVRDCLKRLTLLKFMELEDIATGSDIDELRTRMESIA